MGDATTLRISADVELPLEVVTEATAIVATRGAGKSSASAVIVEEAFGLHVQAVILDRTGVYHGLRSNKRGDGPGLGIYVLGGPHGDAPLEPHAGVLIADLSVYELLIPHDEFVAATLRLGYLIPAKSGGIISRVETGEAPKRMRILYGKDASTIHD